MANPDNSDPVAQPSGAAPGALAPTSVTASAAPSPAAVAADAPADPLPSPGSEASPGSVAADLGTALNIPVPSQGASRVVATITGLPTNGTVVLADGSTPVSVGETLSLAQLGGLRFKATPSAALPTAAAVPASSVLSWTEATPGGPATPMSIAVPSGPSTSTVPPPPSPTAIPLATTAPPANQNPIVAENQKPGATDWQIAPGGDSTEIQGFTTSISTPVGGTVQFKIDNQTGNPNYQIKIYRLGYYGGDGATLVQTIDHQSDTPVTQPAPLVDSPTNPTYAGTGAVDAGNWSVTDAWAVPADATSGVYVANVVTSSAADGSSQVFQIPLVITNPSSTSDIVFQTSDETWQAYNQWGGASLYGGNGPSITGASYAVSYNRPIVTRDSIGGIGQPADFLFGGEYAAIYWLEENGYDVSYISGIDTATNGSLLLNHKVFMDAGHDEYWTDSQRANVQNAANQGVNLAFLSGNEIFWKTRLAPSTDPSATPDRTLVSYKDTLVNEEIDPSGTATSTFADPRFGSPPEPANALSGTLSQVDGGNDSTVQITIPYGETQLRFWRNTDVAATPAGQPASLEPGLLGYEWDSSPDNGFRPAGLVDLSSTSVDEPQGYLTNWGGVQGSGSATQNLVEYRNPQSGALVFGAGTTFWPWGLSIQHDDAPVGSTPDANVQQATVNVLADMGVQAQTLQTDLAPASPSTDTTPPTSSISSVSGNIVEGQPVTVTGTASDVGGVIAGVEVSTDGGQTWHPANTPVGAANETWTYTFSASAPGAYTIESRAVDDSLNLETPGPGVSYTVAPSSALSLFNPSPSDTPPPSSNDPQAVEVGVQFTSATSGQITGLRFYKESNDTGTHVGDLWSASGTLLASATFTNESDSGWQQVNFASPVTITAGTPYIASYHTDTGNYADTPSFFATYQGQSSGSLTAAGNGLNGVFAYGPMGSFPNTISPTGDNYWVDVVFNDNGGGTPQAAPMVNSDNGLLTAPNTAAPLPASTFLAMTPT
ncbi:MAG: DUF4082 domain-containing protein [Acetobacteraceae bacterium]|nr:DUF4082 domain-containing protein [Acetobacteraceae bacterium]